LEEKKRHEIQMKIEEENRMKLDQEKKEQQKMFQELFIKNDMEHQKRMCQIKNQREEDIKALEDDFNKWEKQNKLQYDLINLNYASNIQQINYKHQNKINEMNNNFQNQMYMINQKYLNDLNNMNMNHMQLENNF